MGVTPQRPKKISRFEEIELLEGKPMADILRNLYERYERQSIIAKVLGVTQGTLSQWLVRCGLKQKTILVPLEEVVDTEVVGTEHRDSPSALRQVELTQSQA